MLDLGNLQACSKMEAEISGNFQDRIEVSNDSRFPLEVDLDHLLHLKVLT